MIYPFVTAMIVARNEERYIENCFRSLIEQNYPIDRYEILIIDGLSDDGTLEIAKEVANLYKVHNQQNEKVLNIRFLNNPKRLLAAGWNLGIQEAKGKYVIRIDAHGYADRNFILNSVEAMLKVEDAVCVGGTLKTEALSEKGEVIANVLSSPFGVGDSKFRYSQKAQYVDTVAFGLYKKSIFDRVGYFDETLKRNQDNDMHRRIKDSGGKFYLDPVIKSTYHPRDSVKGMMKQGFQNGKWNIITLRKDNNSLSLRHLIPLLFVLAIMSLLVLGVLSQIFWILLGTMLGVYFILGFIFSLYKTRKIKHLLLMPILFFLFHLSYGTGSLLSILYIGEK